MASNSIMATQPFQGVISTQGLGNSLSLYVGDLDASVNEMGLFNFFSQVAPVISVRVCRDKFTGASLGYGYVNFADSKHACMAKDVLNFTPINGKPIRIMFSQRDPIRRKTGQANVFIKNLDSSIDSKTLHDIFANFGTILSCKVALDNNGRSKGYGFIQFENELHAQNSIKSLNNMLINDMQVYVGPFIRRQQREVDQTIVKFKNVYVKNLPETTTEEELKKLFVEFSPITRAVVMRDSNGNSRCFGFVNFESSDSATKAIEKLNGKLMDENKILYVARAEKKVKRDTQNRAPSVMTHWPVASLIHPFQSHISFGPSSTGVLPPPMAIPATNGVFRHQPYCMPLFRPPNFAPMPHNFHGQLGH